MLLYTALLFLFSANLVTSRFLPPEAFPGHYPPAVLQPLNDGLETEDSPDNARYIRALLAVRKECSTGYTECTYSPGRLVLQFAFFSFPCRVCKRKDRDHVHFFETKNAFYDEHAQSWNNFTQVLSNRRELLRWWGVLPTGVRF